jgi:hypothetical protein
LIHAKAYHAAAKGKIERWFRTVRQQFLPTLGDQQKASLADLNQALWNYVESEYHHNLYRILGKSPLDRWARHAEHIRYPEPGLDLDELFLAEEKRKIHKDRTISLHGKVYEADAALVGETVNLRYDPATPGQAIQVWFKNKRYDDAKLVNIFANCFVKRDRPSNSLIVGDKKPESGFTAKPERQKKSMKLTQLTNKKEV